MFDNVAYVNKSKPRITATDKVKMRVGISGLPIALQCDKVYWASNPLPKSKLDKYDLFLVNVFPQSKHLHQLRKMFPNKVIVAMPDPHLEKFLLSKENIEHIFEFKLCDLIGARTPTGAKLYSALSGTKAIWMPSPIGPTEQFEPYRHKYTQKEFVLSIDHKCKSEYTMQNIAAIAELKRRRNIDVILVNPQKYSKLLADRLNVKIKFKDFIPYGDFLRLVAQSKIGIDMYAAHSQHRHGLTHAMLGTPLVSSMWSNPNGHVACDPYDSQRAADLAEHLLDDEAHYENIRIRGFEYIDKYYSYAACRNRVKNILEEFNV